MKYPNSIEFPTEKQAEAVRLAKAALEVASWKEADEPESLICAADYLDRQISDCRTDSANDVLRAIAAHYRNEAINR